MLSWTLHFFEIRDFIISATNYEVDALLKIFDALFIKKFKILCSIDHVILFKYCKPEVQILIKELQMIFQTSDIGISNSKIKDAIETLTFHTKFYM